MSLADQLVQPKAATKRQDETKILVLDIERVKGEAGVEFWDLGDFKNRRIHADDVTRWPRTICFAAAWFNVPNKTMFHAEWQADGYEGMMHAAWTLYDTADILVGHNLANFDTKKLKAGWKDLHLPPPSPWKTVDTLTIARREFGYESNTLDALCKRWGLVSKTDRYNHELAKAACAGDKAAQRQIRAYNIGDIAATRAAYVDLMGWMPSHPIVGGEVTDELACPTCGSEDLARDGWWTAQVKQYAAYRCANCGQPIHSSHSRRTSNARGSR